MRLILLSGLAVMTGASQATVVLQGASVTTDIFVRSDEPNRGYDEDSMEIDMEWTPHKWALLKFEIPSTITDVVSAHLEVSVHNSGNASKLHEMLVHWDSNSTFASFGTSGAGIVSRSSGVWDPVAVAEMNGSLGTQTMDVTSSVARWLSGQSTNHGWIWQSTDTDGVDFYSSTGDVPPRLTISSPEATMVLQGASVTTDIFVRSDEPDTGHDEDSMEIDMESTTHKWALLKFDFPSTLTDVVSAHLEVSVHNSGDTSKLHDMLVHWDSNSTFSSIGMSGTGIGNTGVWDPTVVAEMSGRDGTQTIDVTSSVARWLSGQSTNYGWIWEPTGIDGVDFYSSTGIVSPRLTIYSQEACWDVGLRVMIKPGSRYDGQASGSCATVATQTCSGGGYIAYTFDNGYGNSYEYEDLQLCQSSSWSPSPSWASWSPSPSWSPYPAPSWSPPQSWSWSPSPSWASWSPSPSWSPYPAPSWSPPQVTDPCSSAQEMPDLQHRLVTFNDGDGGVEFCDRDLSGWYKYPGDFRMADSAPSIYSCGTDSPGYLSPAHPTLLVGEQTSATVCYHWGSSACMWQNTIQVKACADGYVYELSHSPDCDLAYCFEAHVYAAQYQSSSWSPTPSSTSWSPSPSPYPAPSWSPPQSWSWSPSPLPSPSGSWSPSPYPSPSWGLSPQVCSQSAAEQYCLSLGPDWRIDYVDEVGGSLYCLYGALTTASNCNSCESFRIVVWKDGGGETKHDAESYPFSTAACNVYSSHTSPCDEGPDTLGDPCDAFGQACWDVGERVMIKPGTRYDGQAGGSCATVAAQTCQGGGYNSLTFDNGYQNTYEHEDLQLCQEDDFAHETRTACGLNVAAPVTWRERSDNYFACIAQDTSYDVGICRGDGDGHNNVQYCDPERTFRDCPGSLWFVPCGELAEYEGPYESTDAPAPTLAFEEVAECSTSQMEDGCCSPLGSIADRWSFNSSGGGSWSVTDQSIRFDFADDAYCGGNATETQHGVATLTLETTSSTEVILTMSGMAESSYETFVLSVDGEVVTTVHASDGEGCASDTCDMCAVAMPRQRLTMSPGSALQIAAHSGDGMYHSGAYYDITFTSSRPGCAACTCAQANSTSTTTLTTTTLTLPEELGAAAVSQYEVGLVELLIASGRESVTVEDEGVIGIAQRVNVSTDVPVKVDVPDNQTSTQIPVSVFAGLNATTAIVVAMSVQVNSFVSRGAGGAEGSESSSGGAATEVRRIMSLSIATEDGIVRVSGLEEPIVITFSGDRGVRANVCGFWDETAEKWIFDGMEARQAADGSFECLTYHLTIFGAIWRGILSTLECNQVGLLSAESYDEMWRGHWVGQASAILLYCLGAMLSTMLAFACAFDCMDWRKGDWLDADFLIVPRAGEEMLVLDVDASMPVTSSSVIRTTSASRSVRTVATDTTATGGSFTCSETLKEMAEQFVEYLSHLLTVFEATVIACRELRAGGARAGVLKTAQAMLHKSISSHASAIHFLHWGDAQLLLEDSATLDELKAENERMRMRKEDRDAAELPADATTKVKDSTPTASMSTAARSPASAMRTPTSAASGQSFGRMSSRLSSSWQSWVGSRFFARAQDPEATVDKDPELVDTDPEPPADKELEPGPDGGPERSAERVRPSAASIPQHPGDADPPRDRGSESADKSGSEGSDEEEHHVVCCGKWADRLGVGPESRRDSPHEYLVSLHSQLTQTRSDRIGKVRWLSMPKMVCANFVMHSALGHVFSRSLRKPRSMRALLLSTEILGALMLQTLFFEVSGGALSKMAPEECEDSCEESGGEHCAWESLGRSIGVGLLSALIAAVPIALFESLHRREFTKVKSGRHKRLQLKLWVFQDTLMWIVSLAYCAFAVNYCALFFANVGPNDQSEWLWASVVLLAIEGAVVPFAAAFVLPGIAFFLIFLLMFTHGHSLADALHKAKHWRSSDDDASGTSEAADARGPSTAGVSASTAPAAGDVDGDPELASETSADDAAAGRRGGAEGPRRPGRSASGSLVGGLAARTAPAAGDSGAELELASDSSAESADPEPADGDGGQERAGSGGEAAAAGPDPESADAEPADGDGGPERASSGGEAAAAGPDPEALPAPAATPAGEGLELPPASRPKGDAGARPESGAWTSAEGGAPLEEVEKEEGPTRASSNSSGDAAAGAAAAALAVCAAPAGGKAGAGPEPPPPRRPRADEGMALVPEPGDGPKDEAAPDSSGETAAGPAAHLEPGAEEAGGGPEPSAPSGAAEGIVEGKPALAPEVSSVSASTPPPPAVFAAAAQPPPPPTSTTAAPPSAAAWEFEASPGSWKRFGDDCVEYVEKKYQEFQQGAEARIQVTTGRLHVTVDFQFMTQKARGGAVRCIRRLTAEHRELVAAPGEGAEGELGVAGQSSRKPSAIPEAARSSAASSWEACPAQAATSAAAAGASQEASPPAPPRPIWEFQVASGWKRFDDDCHSYVEAKHQDFLKGGAQRVTVKTGSVRLSLDFKTMTQKPMPTGQVRSIRRREQSGDAA